MLMKLRNSSFKSLHHLRTLSSTPTLTPNPNPNSNPNPNQKGEGEGEGEGGGGGGDDDEEEINLEKQASSIHHIITHSPSPDSMIESLHSSNLSSPLLSSPDLLDLVLRRSRFSHSDPLRSLSLFSHLSSHRHFFPSPSSLDTLLYILGRSRLFRHAWNLLVRMSHRDPSLITPRSLAVLLARVAKCCSVRQTVETFRRFRKFLPLDTAAHNALLRTLSQEKSMADARNVYHSVKSQFRPDTRTFNILLSGWKSVQDANSFLAEMIELGVKPDLVTYNCLIDVYCKNREMEKAYALLGKMREEEIYPDVITYTILIGGLGLVGQPDKAREVLKEMREAGRYPDAAAYNAVVRNYCIAKRLGDAFALMDEMSSKGIAPNATTYNVVFRSLFWANDLESARRLYGRMRGEGCLPNTQSCMFLVRMCRRQENVEVAMELWGDMVEKGFGSFVLVSDVLLDLLCDLGKLEEAERCFGEMVEKGQKPSQVSFRRIKVLMELAKRHEGIRSLEEKMKVFEKGGGGDGEREDGSTRLSWSDFPFSFDRVRKGRPRKHT